MSALSQKQTIRLASGMSALPAKVDIVRHAQTLISRCQIRALGKGAAVSSILTGGTSETPRKKQAVIPALVGTSAFPHLIIFARDRSATALHQHQLLRTQFQISIGMCILTLSSRCHSQWPSVDVC